MSLCCPSTAFSPLFFLLLPLLHQHNLSAAGWDAKFELAELQLTTGLQRCWGSSHPEQGFQMRDICCHVRQTQFKLTFWRWAGTSALQEKGPFWIVTSVVQGGFHRTHELPWGGWSDFFFLLCIKYKLLFMWGFALGRYIFCYCLFLPPKTLRIPLPHVLFTSLCGFVLYHLEWVGEAQFYGFLIEK